jgi:hypothetical protein
LIPIALKEWGLPYASDGAVTRHLAEFLSDRPRVDAVLFNGGSIRPPLLRQRLREQIGVWQDGVVPLVLENEEPDLAVARGAARFGALLHQHSSQIAAGAAHAVFLEVDNLISRPANWQIQIAMASELRPAPPMSQKDLPAALDRSRRDRSGLAGGPVLDAWRSTRPRMPWHNLLPRCGHSVLDNK